MTKDGAHQVIQLSDLDADDRRHQLITWDIHGAGARVWEILPMACLASYTDPRTGETVETRASSSLSIGRQPRHPGLVIAPGDVAVSRVAVEVRLVGDELWIANTSRYASLEIRAGGTVRTIAPGETSTIAGSCVLVLPGSDGVHTITLARATATIADQPEPAPVVDSTDPTPVDRTMPMTTDRPFWGNRLPVLAALCASRLYPGDDRWTATSIDDLTALLATAGYDVTAESVNADLRAARDRITADTRIRFVSRDDLADHLVSHQLVTCADVDLVLRGDAPAASVDPSLAGLVSSADQALLDPTPLEMPLPDSAQS